MSHLERYKRRELVERQLALHALKRQTRLALRHSLLVAWICLVLAALDLHTVSATKAWVLGLCLLDALLVVALTQIARLEILKHEYMQVMRQLHPSSFRVPEREYAESGVSVY